MSTAELTKRLFSCTMNQSSYTASEQASSKVHSDFLVSHG